MLTQASPCQSYSLEEQETIPIHSSPREPRTKQTSVLGLGYLSGSIPIKFKQVSNRVEKNASGKLQPSQLTALQSAMQNKASIKGLQPAAVPSRLPSAARSVGCEVGWLCVTYCVMYTPAHKERRGSFCSAADKPQPRSCCAGWDEESGPSPAARQEAASALWGRWDPWEPQGHPGSEGWGHSTGAEEPSRPLSTRTFVCSSWRNSVRRTKRPLKRTQEIRSQIQL